MKRLAIAIAVLAGLTAGPAFSADLPFKAPPPAPLPSWTGFYVGASLGGRWLDTTADEIGVSINGTPQPCPATGTPCVTSESLHGSAVRAGGYLGYNWQVSPNWVVGIEGDGAWAHQTSTLYGMGLPGPINGFLRMSVGSPNGPADSFSVTTNWDASLRARAGYLVTPTTLLYLTGGAAWLNFNSTSSCALAPAGSCTPTVSPLSITNSSTRLGWTIGGGGEFRLSSNWFVRLEYRYEDFGTATYTNTTVNTVPGVGSFVYLDTYDVHIRTHTGLVGVSYKFN